MNSVEAKAPDLNERLATSGLRFTPQRQHVYGVLLQTRDHPTAEEVFIRSKKIIPDISLATVYNCLDALVKCGLVRQVHHERGATRYCPNMSDHAHFYCDQCGAVFDVDFPAPRDNPRPNLPAGFQVRRLDITFRGVCSKCGAQE
ncbi:MAG: Fur family transcriptional regulator [Verrucomicrobiota bacterium]|jgi:Fur family transcriptional regulator, peroxide stress response regulator